MDKRTKNRELEQNYHDRHWAEEAEVDEQEEALPSRYPCRL